ncbi:PLP-dependent aminotransferase family protein [Lysobacter sp. LF1]|uniref:PLP-dependent aminotransferase family protein n=1 Tax=Lysobacter stagni TaxID=3045172 RepID=A0ABT6XDL3_9GAMM|nr:PLP-dependent aminotransferase family protein [Lysobacter sp. LF1]MDI9238213.1 PLP-dependent aminotransferase family protein [Lysobacter sp. LF1]
MTPQEPVFEFPLDIGATGANRTRLLHEQLRTAILEQRLRAGTELPSTRRVASAYRIARNTVIAAYDLLLAEGYVVTRAGAKAVVADVVSRPAASVRRATRRADRAPRLGATWQPPSWSSAVQAGDEWTTGFRLGVPDHRAFPFDVWRRLLSRAFHPRHGASLGYQPPHGRPRLREAIAGHVSFARAVSCRGEDVIVTSGARQAFDLLARLLIEPGRTTVAVEDPGYPTVHATMSAAGARVVPVPVDSEGLRVDQLPGDARLIYVTPSHQYPTGVAMSMARRRALLGFAREHDTWIIEDDYDGEFRYGARPLDALQTLDREGRVIYVGTFSKSVFPSLRIGYVVAPPWLRDALAAAKEGADTCGNGPLQDALADFILEGHLARHVRRMRKVYAARRAALNAAFDGPLSRWFEPVASEAGIHVTARLSDADGANALIPRILEHAPGAIPLHALARRDDAMAGIAFGIGCIDEDAIADRLDALARSLAR